MYKALDVMVKESGYRRAPKNAFQIYREINVNGEEMIFHVDFLHRKYADDTDNLIMQWGRYESIATAGTDIIFTRKEIRNEVIKTIGFDGNQISAKIPFASEASFLSSKGRSVGFGKRTRDGFDVFLVIKQSQDYAELLENCRTLMSDSIFSKSMKLLYEKFFLDKSKTVLMRTAEFFVKMAPSEVYDQRIFQITDKNFLHQNLVASATDMIQVTIKDFLEDLGADKLAIPPVY